MPTPSTQPLVAIACGGTGGHLFPGRAVAEEVLARGCRVTLLISAKEVDQRAAQTAAGMKIVTLSAVAFRWSKLAAFVGGTWRSFRRIRCLFREEPPRAVLAMGGFTSAPVVLAGKLAGAAAFLHESNVRPGRANRWLARWVDRAFVAFPQAAPQLRARSVEVTGTPVRPEFQPTDPAAARVAMGLDATRPLLLITGGSQGASGLNHLLMRSLSSLKQSLPELQYLHLTGSGDFDKVRAAYQAEGLRAIVRPFLTEMELALAAATVAVSRAGGSSLAELAAMRLPAILIPFPFAADDHQSHNALAFAQTGAAWMLPQRQAVPELFLPMLKDLVSDESRREAMKRALAQWHKPDAAASLAETITRPRDVQANPMAGAETASRFLPRPEPSELNS